MSMLPELRLIACRIARDTFEREHAGLYLLAILPSEEEELDFHTAVAENPLAQAEAALGTTGASLASSAAAGADFTLCHGIAGNAELLLYGAAVGYRVRNLEFAAAGHS